MWGALGGAGELGSPGKKESKNIDCTAGPFVFGARLQRLMEQCYIQTFGGKVALQSDALHGQALEAPFLSGTSRQTWRKPLTQLHATRLHSLVVESR